MTNSANKIDDNPPRSELIAIEGQTAFDYDFWIADEGDIKVAINGGDPLVLHTDYAVDPAGIQNNNGGTITLVAGRNANDVVVAYRETSLARPNSYSEGGAGFFGGAGLNVAFNILYAIIQELFNNLQRTLRLSASSTYSGNLTLPTPVAGKALQWNATADGVENSANSVDTVVTTAEGFATAASDSADTASGAAVIALDARDDANAHADDASLSADAAAASAASINLPDSTGQGSNYIRQKAAEDGFEYQTPEQVFNAIKQAASTTVSGAVELATNAEAIAGTDTSRAVTPAGVKEVIDNFSPAPTTGWETITTTTFSGQTAVAFNNILDASIYSQIQFVVNIKPDTDPMSQRLGLQFGNNGTYEFGSTDYMTTLSSIGAGQTFNDSRIDLGYASSAAEAGGGAGEKFRSIVDILKGWDSATEYTAVLHRTNYDHEGGDTYEVSGAGRRNNPIGVHTDVRFIAASAFSGDIEVRGYRYA